MRLAPPPIVRAAEEAEVFFCVGSPYGEGLEVIELEAVARKAFSFRERVYVLAGSSVAEPNAAAEGIRDVAGFLVGGGLLSRKYRTIPLRQFRNGWFFTGCLLWQCLVFS
jgi:hypothetical protein